MKSSIFLSLLLTGFILLAPSFAKAACDTPVTNIPTPATADTVCEHTQTPIVENNVVEGSSGDVPIYNEGDAVPLIPNEATAEPSCGHPDFIGKNIKDIDQTTIKGPVRILYPDSPATMDYSPNRINIILEHGTDTITEVRCG